MNKSQKAKGGTERGLRALTPAPRSFQKNLVHHTHSRLFPETSAVLPVSIHSVPVTAHSAAPAEPPLHWEPTRPTPLPGQANQRDPCPGIKASY